MNSFASIVDGDQLDALIGMYDIDGFTRISRTASAREILELIQSIARVANEHVSRVDGLVVKFIGDAALFAFPDERVDEAVSKLFAMKQEIEALLRDRDLRNTLTVSLHFGGVVFGKLPPFDSWDILGDSVNTLWTLDRGIGRGQFVISPQAFRKLGTANRKRFHKYTPPIVYLSERPGTR